MNIKEFAEKLNNRQIGDEITDSEKLLARELGFVVVFGYSDDNTEFKGAIDEELGSYNGEIFYIDNRGIIEECECSCKCYQDRVDASHKVEAIAFSDECMWKYETDIPHEIFNIYEDDELFCIGIVFDINNLGG